MSKRTKNSNIITIALATIAAILLVVANSALWVHRYVFDTENFTRITTTSLSSQSSRDAIAGSIINRALENRPVIRSVVEEPATRVISGLLATDQFSGALDAVTSRFHVLVTSRSQESISINLEGVKSTAAHIISLFDTQATGENLGNIPDEIIIINAQNIPDFYRYGVLFLWLGPLSFLLAATALVYPYYRRLLSVRRILLIQGLAITVFSLLAMSIGPLFKPPLLANIDQVYARVVANNIYDAFINTFINQTKILLGIGCLAIASAVFLYVFPKLRHKQ